MELLKNILFRVFGQKNHFEKLFFLNEFNDLTGKSRKSIVALSLILALTISALGYAIGGLEYLKERMDNPFTNWVNLPIPNSYKSKVNKLDVYFEDQANLDSFALRNITKYKIESKESFNLEDGLAYPLKTRTVGVEEDILKEILKGSNVVSGYRYRGGDLDFPKCGVIIKEQALRDNLAYTEGQSISKIPLVTPEFIFFPEVVAIVKELPNLCNMLITSHYSNLLSSNPGESGFVQMNPVNIMQFVGNFTNADNEANEVKIKSIFSDYAIDEIVFDKIKLDDKNSLDQFTITLLDFLDFDEIKEISKQLEDQRIMKSPRPRYKSECNVGKDYSNLKNPHYVAFNFNKLDMVRDFNEFLKTDPRFGMEISMDQVESKENFALVSKLTGLMALILLAFSILSIVFYINSLLTTHLEGIKNNLGTLKAFGLNNKFLVSTYIKIIILFILISIVIGFIISFVIKGMELGFSKIAVIDLFDYKIFITLFIILLFSTWTSYRSIKKILLKTPGDLIYNR